MNRTFWKTDTPLSRDSATAHEAPEVIYQPATEDEATLVGSSTGAIGKDGPIHLPAIDIDLPCELVPSSTEGHFHLYIDKPMSWGTYKNLLQSLVDAGIVEPGYASASIRRGQSFLRKPGVKK